MEQLGIDIGTSSIKMVVLKGEKVTKKYRYTHHGQLLAAIEMGMRELDLKGKIRVCVTGANAQIMTDRIDGLQRIEYIPAVVEGVRYDVPDAGSIIDIGGQGSRFITNLKEKSPEFSVNEHCAGGTGSFFEDQMSRLGMRIQDYSEIVKKAESIPRLSGRCSVFAKTDIIHRQQEGVSIPDILLGLCYAMTRNYKATIVRTLPVEKPVVYVGGVTQNSGTVRAIKEIFGLNEEELVLPEYALYEAAIGAALSANNQWDAEELMQNVSMTKTRMSEQAEISITEKMNCRSSSKPRLKKLSLVKGTVLIDPVASQQIPEDGCALGIDIGSTSTDLVLIDQEGKMIDYQYLRTAGDPEGAVRRGLQVIREKYGELTFLAVGVTGSGRERIGRMIGADAVRDEITAQAKGAAFWMPEVDTVFEIGGQDSKYISLKNGEVVDFQMNKICAAGTGSFVEEQAARMGIPIEQFGDLALQSDTPEELGERCTVFIESSIDSAQSRGVKQEDIAAGLCYSIVRNYLHKVVGNKPIGSHILLQGGVAYNPGIVAAFQNACGEHIEVSPFFSISGAFGAAILAMESMEGKQSSFAGFDFSGDISHTAAGNEEIRRNMDFYQLTTENFYRNYDGKRNPNKKTVGIPYVLMIHKFFPMANAFFKALGYNVILSDPSNEETIRLAQETARGETCYPVKLIYGHMIQLINQKVDYIFLPHMHTLRHEMSKVAYNYGCIYMQSAALSIAKSLELEKKGITFLNPVFDLDFGKEAMGNAMLSVGKQLGKPKPLCAAALLAGAKAVRKYDQEAERLGRELLSDVKPGEPVLVMITRGYGITDPVLNMGIPELLLQRGYKVINLEHLPGHSLDLSEDYTNMYWPFGQHILTGAKLIAGHPNLYAVYLTNHGCGPDSMLSYMFREEMGDKPYLQIEVDEHFSKVGVITRIEAFLHALRSRKEEVPKTEPVDIHFRGERIAYQGSFLEDRKEDTLYIPDFGLYTDAILQYIREVYEINADSLPGLSSVDFLTGRAETTAKEYVPFPALLGSILSHVQTLSDEDRKHAIYLIPSTEGAEADGQYARAIRSVLDHKGYTEIGIFAPVLEKLPVILKSPQELFNALLEADLLYLVRPKTREKLIPVYFPDIRKPKSETSQKTIAGYLPNTGALLSLLKKEAELEDKKKRILVAVGTPMTQTSLCENVLDKLEEEGERLLRAPVTEYLLFLWQEERKIRSGCEDFLKECTSLLAELCKAIRPLQAFSMDMEKLHQIADRYLGEVTGANVRYRYAKTVEFGESADAVLCAAPRYENAAMVMEMRNLQKAVKAPVYQMYFDGDWDEAAWERLRSFLYYCSKKY